jgi:hypothetical protein
MQLLWTQWAQPRVSQLDKHISDECRDEDLAEDQRQTHIVLNAQSKAPVGGGTVEAAAPAGPAPLSGSESYSNK